jgi:hypothetical protein
MGQNAARNRERQWYVNPSNRLGLCGKGAGFMEVAVLRRLAGGRLDRGPELHAYPLTRTSQDCGCSTAQSGLELELPSGD